MNRLEGLEFLEDKRISGKECDLSKPFAFISYAHDNEDSKIVKYVFLKLYEKGYNIWIDTANIPKNENSWKDAAQDALMNEEETCKVALFFRSEESLIRKPIYDELEMIKELKHIHRIITIDIWHEEGMNADKYGKQLIRDKKKDEGNIYKDICTLVNKNNSAYRLQDVGNNWDNLVEELESELIKEGITPQGTKNEAQKVIFDQGNGQETIDNKRGEDVSETLVVSEYKEAVIDGITGPLPLKKLKEELDSREQIKPDTDLKPGCIKKWNYRTKKGANAFILWDGSSKNCKVLKGSIAAKESPAFATSAAAAKNLKDLLVSQGKFSDLEFIADYDCDKISTMINLLNGGSVSMPAEIKGRNLRLVEEDDSFTDAVSLETGTNNQELKSMEPTPLVEPTGSSSGEYIYTYKNVRIQCDINSNTCTVLKGSKVQGESPKFATNAAGAKKLKDELNQKRIIENDVFLEDYTGSMATLLNLINGGSVSSTREKEKFVREN